MLFRSIYTAWNEVGAVREALEKKGYQFLSAQAEYVPSTYVRLDGENAEKMEKLLDLLEEHDDVQEVWHNWDQD